MDFHGKTALVTGASRGIGRAISIEFAQQGIKRLILVARNPQRLALVANEVRSLGVEAVIIPLDLADTVAVNVAMAKAWQQQGPIHLLINCAGVAHQTPFLTAKLPQVQAEISTNLLGLYTVTRAIARRMATHRQGHIVNVSSLMGKIAAPSMATYSATKFAIVGFSQALRSELSPHNVQVSALLPSLTDTDMVRQFQWFRWVKPNSPEQVAQALVKGLKRKSPEIFVGWQSHVAGWGNRLCPQLIEKTVHFAAPQPKRSILSLQRS